MKEFHMGIAVTKVMDFKLEANSKEEAEAKFKELSAKGELSTLDHQVLDTNYDVLGMLEGPLPITPSVDESVALVH
jgi:hypothetical protein